MVEVGSRARVRVPRLLVLLVVATLVAGACSNSGEDADTSSGGGGADGSGDADGGGDLPADLGEGPHGEFEAIEGVPGVTDDEIRFAVLGTGPANPLGYCLLDCTTAGVEAYFAYRNSQGGVNGRQLVFDVIDDELASNQVKALEIIESGDYFGVIANPLLASGFADLASAGYPVYTATPQAVEANGVPSIYQPTGTLCVTCPNRNFVHPATVVGASTVGVIGLGAAQASKDCVAGQVASFDRWGGELGIEVGYSNDTLPFGLPNGVGPEVSAMKEAGVEFVLTCMDQVSVLTLEQEMQRQGMGDVPVLLPQGYGDRDYLAANAELLEGDIIGVTYRPFEADPAGTALEEFNEWIAETGNVTSDPAMLAWIGADLAFRGILAAGPQFDQASVVEATNTFTEFTADGLVSATDWTRQHDAPTPDDPVTHGPAMQCYAYVRVVGGTYQLEGDPEQPHYCWDPAEDGWQGPTPTSFAS